MEEYISLVSVLFLCFVVVGVGDGGGGVYTGSKVYSVYFPHGKIMNTCIVDYL